MVAEEYLNPGTLSTPVDTPLPSTPTQKFFSSGPSSLPAPELHLLARLPTQPPSQPATDTAGHHSRVERSLVLDQQRAAGLTQIAPEVFRR